MRIDRFHVYAHALILRLMIFISIYISCFKVIIAGLVNSQSRSLVTVLYFFQQSSPIWVIRLFRDPVPSKPHYFSLNIHSQSQPHFLVLLSLWRVILSLTGVPEKQGDTNGRQSHYTKCSPVQIVWREAPVKLPLSQDTSLARGAGVTNHNLSSFLCQVTYGRRGEIEVASLQGTQHHCVRDIAGWCDPVPFNI